MKLVQPEERVGDEEVAHLVAAVVEDVRSPVGVLALARVGVLVERGAVEAGQAPVVLREVRRDPVDDDADARLVESIDEIAEVVGVTESGGRGEVAADLIAPRGGERVLGDRQQFDVGEPEPSRRASANWSAASRVRESGLPRAEVHLVDPQRPIGRRGVASRSAIQAASLHL